MIIDCHVHVSAFTPEHGRMSPRVLGSLPFRFMRWRLGLVGSDEATERAIEERLASALRDAHEVDAAVVLAFDAVYGRDGGVDLANTHLYVSNEYVMELAERHQKMLFGASVHPYRSDAVAELERCVRGGAVLVKWLPITQGIDPADPRCFPFYEALAHYGVPLLSHTGGERTLPNLDTTVADPSLLLPALERGVTVIAAHCGTRSVPGERCYLDVFMRMAREHERFFGDTSALNLPTRWYAYQRILENAEVREKLVHGSDWPVMPIAHPRHLGWRSALSTFSDANWIRRDVHIKRGLGLDDRYWTRAAGLLRTAVAVGR
jgi:predicted TIM-barrel fold metal-dependent hydrolase